MRDVFEHQFYIRRFSFFAERIVIGSHFAKPFSFLIPFVRNCVMTVLLLAPLVIICILPQENLAHRLLLHILRLLMKNLKRLHLIKLHIFIGFNTLVGFPRLQHKDSSHNRLSSPDYTGDFAVINLFSRFITDLMYKFRMK